ncbi:ankyrin repeat domain-containing protein [Pedobacter sp. AW31-3R]|uniref:ankyrin repeat domain-containing protein n=1 Tax=Pedobacter sp. AW31-3R TaxID=3445781 RepID=UPI003F9F8755
MQDHTLLVEAFKNSNFQEARELLKEESNFPSDLRPFERIPLFDQLIIGRAFDIIQLLVDHQLIETDLFEYDTFDRTLVQSIFKNLKEDEESVAFLDDFLSRLQSLNDEVKGESILAYALENGTALFIIKGLIQAGCDINWVNNAEDTYLHQITSNNRINPERAAEYLVLFLAEGLDINATNVVDKTPLMEAISRNKPVLIEILLENGASCNVQDKSGETAFYNAVVNMLNPKLYLKMVEYESPDFELRTKNGETILHEYIKRLNRPAEESLNFLTRMIEDGADLYAPALYYGKEKTPVATAAEKPFEIFKAILDTGKVEVSATDEEGNTILHLVCKYDINFDKEAAKDTYRKVKALLELGADANLSNSRDETPLMLASSDNLKSKTVELLLTNKN